MSSLNVGLIGYRNQAGYILNQLIKKKFIKKIIIFCHKKINEKEKKKNNRVFYVYKLEDLKNINCVFIASPTNFHLKYISFFLNKNIMIFCEKPGMHKNSDIKTLNNLKSSIKRKIYFNYNLNHSDFKYYLDNLIKDKKKFYLSIMNSYGIAFKKELKDNWRFTSKNIFNKITGNLGSHYINLILNAFKTSSKIIIKEYGFSDRKITDTCSINIFLKDQFHVNIFLSYALPFHDEIKLFYDDGYYNFSKDNISLFSPRDSFNKENQFTTPPKKILKKYNKDMYKTSINRSIDFFLKTVLENGSFELSTFKNAIETSKVLLKFKS